MEQGVSIIRGVLDDTRLDQSLSKAVPGVSRQRLKALILEGRLRVDGASVTDPSTRKLAGRAFELDIPPARPLEAEAQAIPLTIAFEDEHLIIVDKQAGLVVHPAAGHADGTLVNALLHHCAGQLSGIGGIERPGIVHRIDRDTSGLMVSAKTDRAHEGLARLFATHDIERRYLAIVHGRPNPSSGTVETLIGRSPHDRRKMCVTESQMGKRAVTHFRTVRMLDKAALVECTLETGRTHQVRVHMAHLGHPLIGDPMYEGRKRHSGAMVDGVRFARQALHAAVLGFVHPVTQENLRFESPIPEDMQQLFSNILI